MITVTLCDRCHTNVRPELAYVTMTQVLCLDCKRRELTNVQHQRGDARLSTGQRQLSV
jgi:hypothetical protein